MRRLILLALMVLSISSICGCANDEELETYEKKPLSPGNVTLMPASTSNPNEEVHFVTMSDSQGLDHGVNSEVVRRIMEKIKKLSPQPDFAVLPGDLCEGATSYKGVKKQLKYFKDIVTEYYPAEFFYPAIGNHELTSKYGEKAFKEVFYEFNAVQLEGYNKTVYYFDKGNSRFFVLNNSRSSEKNVVSQIQQDWIINNIDPSKTHNLFFMHKPAFPTGEHIGSSLDTNPYMRNKLWKVFDMTNRPMVFCGHEHVYTRRHIDSSFKSTINDEEFTYDKSIYQMTVGGFGSSLYGARLNGLDIPPVSKHHFVEVFIKGITISIKAHSLEGRIIDEFTQDKW